MFKFTQTVATLLLCAGCLSLSPVQADTKPAGQTEIPALLSFVGNSGCAFFRNGIWYDSQAAQKHLQKKLDYALAVSSAEQFIDRVATASSFSNQPYQVRCSDGITVPSSVWLYDALARDRARSANSIKRADQVH